MDDPGLLQTIINTLRSKSTPKGGNALTGKQARGYQLAVQEAKAMGTIPPSYEEWAATASSLSGQ